MADLDLTKAIEAVRNYEWEPGQSYSIWSAHAKHGMWGACAICRGDVEDILRAALPELRKAIAEELRHFAQQAAKTDSPDAILGLLTAAAIASGKRYDSFDALADELDQVMRGGGQ